MGIEEGKYYLDLNEKVIMKRGQDTHFNTECIRITVDNLNRNHNG